MTSEGTRLIKFLQRGLSRCVSVQWTVKLCVLIELNRVQQNQETFRSILVIGILVLESTLRFLHTPVNMLQFQF